MSRLADALDGGEFAVTCELNPPKGTRLEPLFDKAERLKDVVHGINLTDSHASHMAMAPLAVAHLLLDRGAEPILQITTRDRNRIALQADLLGAAALGVENVVVMGGDSPKVGDHPDAKAVFDLYASTLLRAASSLQAGTDLAGNALQGAPRFCLGAVVNPGARDLAGEVGRMEDKIAAGARFFQSQAVYDPSSYERFAEATRHIRVPVLAGIIPLKSPEMAKYMNESIPGIEVPAAIVAEIADAPDRREASIAVASRTIGAIREMAGGVHIMAIGWEDLVPRLLREAGIPPSPDGVKS